MVRGQDQGTLDISGVDEMEVQDGAAAGNWPDGTRLPSTGRGSAGSCGIRRGRGKFSGAPCSRNRLAMAGINPALVLALQDRVADDQLACLAPAVLKRLVYGREGPAVTVPDLSDCAALPWAGQGRRGEMDHIPSSGAGAATFGEVRD